MMAKYSNKIQLNLGRHLLTETVLGWQNLKIFHLFRPSFALDSMRKEILKILVR